MTHSRLRYLLLCYLAALLLFSPQPSKASASLITARLGMHDAYFICIAAAVYVIAWGIHGLSPGAPPIGPITQVAKCVRAL